MSVDFYKDFLYQKWTQKKMGHMYILHLSPLVKDPYQCLLDWTLSFMAQITGRPMELLQGKGHPDLLIIQKQQEKQHEYTLNDFTEFFEFIGLCPLEFGHRFVIIPDASCLSSLLVNKLLKSFEEPPENVSIFLHNPYQAKLMPTLQGRGINLHLPYKFFSHLQEEGPTQRSFQNCNLKELLAEKTNDSDLLSSPLRNFLQELHSKRKTLLDLNTFLRSHPECEKELTELLLDLSLQQQHNYQHKKTVLEHLKWLQESKTFHVNTIGRHFATLQHLLID